MVSVDKKGVVMGSDHKVSRVLGNGVDDFGSYMRLNDQVADAKFGANLVKSGVERTVSEADKTLEINLVVDFSQHCFTKANDVAFIKKESSRLGFNPAKTVDFLLDLAKDPLGVNRLDVKTVEGNLSAFNKWKGYHQLQISQVLGDDEGKPKARGRPRKKVRHMSDLMSNGNGSVSDVEYKPKKRGRKRKAIESKSGEGSQTQTQTQTAGEFISQIYQVARNPTAGHHDLDSLVKLTSDFKNYRLKKDENDKEIGSIAKQPEIIETESECSSKPNEENSVTSLTFKFTSLDSVPSVKKLHEIYGHFGALRESETRVFKKIKCVKLVFERKCDAEAAFSSCGKFSIFGLALVCYQLNFSPTLRKKNAAGKKRVKSVKKNCSLSNR